MWRVARYFSRHYDLHRSPSKLFSSEEEVDLYVIQLFKAYFRTLNQSLLTIHSHYRELGLDDLDKLELVLKLENELGTEVPQKDYDQLATLKSFTHYIMQTNNYKGPS